MLIKLAAISAIGTYSYHVSAPMVAHEVKIMKINGAYNFKQSRAAEHPNAFNPALKGVLHDKANVFFEAGHYYNLCPVTLMAMAMHESANGTSKLARLNNNVLGVYDGKHKCYRKFRSVDDCIWYMTEQIAHSSYYHKCHTISDLQKIYCPIGANNDPKGLNSQWLSGVLSYMRKLNQGANVYLMAL